MTKLRLGGNNREIERTLRKHKKMLGWVEPPTKMRCQKCGAVIIRKSANQKFCEDCKMKFKRSELKRARPIFQEEYEEWLAEQYIASGGEYQEAHDDI